MRLFLFTFVHSVTKNTIRMGKYIFASAVLICGLAVLEAVCQENLQVRRDSLSVVPVDNTTGKINYQEVVSEEGTKNDFFNRAVAWVNVTYKNPTSVTTVRDPQTGKIEGNYRFKIYQSNEGQEGMEWGTILYSFRLEFKDGRYRYSFYDFLLKTDSRYPIEHWLDKTRPDYTPDCDLKLRKVDEFMQSFIPILKQSMKPKAVKEEVEW